jgi:HK97 family phage major capsid protein
MPYNNIISRTDAAAMSGEQVANVMLPNVTSQSIALSAFKKIRVSKSQTRFPVISALPTAYWVNGDTGLKQTSEVNWTNVYMNIEELAVIIPIPQNVLDDSDYDIWEEARPLAEEAIGVAFDAAVFFDTNAPASFPDGIVAAATAAGNTVTRDSTPDPAVGGLAADFSALFAKVEADGYDVNGIIASRLYRGYLRNARASTGVQLPEVANMVNADSIYGVPVTYPMRGAWPAAATGVASAIAGDFNRALVGIRQDVTWKLLTEAAIFDNAGVLIYNLAQQDMVAMRVTFRAGWVMSNPINRDQPTAGDRYPFAALLEP